MKKPVFIFMLQSGKYVSSSMVMSLAGHSSDPFSLPEMLITNGGITISGNPTSNYILIPSAYATLCTYSLSTTRFKYLGERHRQISGVNLISLAFAINTNYCWFRGISKTGLVQLLCLSYLQKSYPSLNFGQIRLSISFFDDS